MGQQVGNRETERKAGQGHGQCHTQRTKVDGDVDPLLLALAYHCAIALALHIDRREKKQSVLWRLQVSYRAPNGGLGPGRISRLKKWRPRALLLGADATGGAHENAAQASLFNIQATTYRAGFLSSGRFFQVLRQSRVNRLWRDLVTRTIPFSQRTQGARQAFRHHRVIDAVEQNTAQGQKET